MQIKKFEVQNMPEALKLIKQEFGSDAVILSVRKIENKRSGVFGFSKATGIEVTAATDMRTVDKKNNCSQIGYTKYQNSPYSLSGFKHLERKKGFIRSFRTGTAHIEKANNPLFSNDRPKNRDIKKLYASYRQMLEQGVEQAIASKLIRDVDSLSLSSSDPSEKGFNLCMMQVLDESGISANRVQITNDKQQRVAVIGPTGVGKTTTIAKLAVAAKTRQNSRRVALVTLDEHRIGAMGQIKTYARIIGIPLKSASSKIGLKKHIESLSDYDLLFIDTPGISQMNQNQIMEIKTILDSIEDVEFHLALSAATNDKTLRDVVNKYRVFPINRLMFTKLDESFTYGGILNQLYLSRLPASYFTNGQQVPEDIEAATTAKIIDLIFSEDGSRYLNGSPEELAEKIIRFERMLMGSDALNEPYLEINGSNRFGRSIAGTDISNGRKLSASRC